METKLDGTVDDRKADDRKGDEMGVRERAELPIYSPDLLSPFPNTKTLAPQAIIKNPKP